MEEIEAQNEAYAQQQEALQDLEARLAAKDAELQAMREAQSTADERTPAAPAAVLDIPVRLTSENFSKSSCQPECPPTAIQTRINVIFMPSGKVGCLPHRHALSQSGLLRSRKILKRSALRAERCFQVEVKAPVPVRSGMGGGGHAADLAGHEHAAEIDEESQIDTQAQKICPGCDALKTQVSSFQCWDTCMPDQAVGKS